jgi:hypothetical protein
MRVTPDTIQQAIDSNAPVIFADGVFPFLEIRDRVTPLAVLCSNRTFFAGLSIRNSIVIVDGPTIEAASGSSANGPLHYGIRVWQGATATLRNCKIRQATKGVVVDDAILSAINCDFAVREDGIIISKGQNCLVSGCRFHSFQMQTGDHSDAVQFRNGTNNLTVVNNVIDDVQQGIGQMDAPNDLLCQGIAIIGNRIAVTGHHSVTVGRSTSVFVADNIARQSRGKKTVFRLPADAVAFNNLVLV